MRNTAIRIMDMISPAALLIWLVMGGISSFSSWREGLPLVALYTLVFFAFLGGASYGCGALLKAIYHNGIEQNRLLAEIANITQITQSRKTLTKEPAQADSQ